MDYGLWDELRIDHGTEWVLLLFLQCQLAQFRNDVSKPPYIQSSSKEVRILYTEAIVQLYVTAIEKTCLVRLLLILRY